LNPGWHIGQSRFLVEDPLRDDMGTLFLFCHVLKDPRASPLPFLNRKGGLPMFVFCED
jgi:hypothetical protein